MQRFFPALVALTFLLSACPSDDPEGGNDAGITADPGTPDTYTPPIDSGPPPDAGSTKSALTGVETNVAVTPPTPNAGCDQSDVETGDFGATYPWGGYTHWDADQTEFTCNQCPNGEPGMSGMYQLIGRTNNGEGELDPDLPELTDWVEVLYIDGNTFYQRMLDAKSGDEWVFRGYYVCTQKPENGNERILWIPTEVDKAGPSGNQAVVGKGAVSDGFLVSQDVEGVFLLYWYDDGALTGGAWLSFEYCKFNADIEGKSCRNRFDEL